MNKNRLSLDIFLKFFFYGLLISPLLAYIYTVKLALPDTIIRWYQMYILMLGIVFILSHEIKYIPAYTWLILGYAVYRFVWAQFTYTGGFYGYFYVTTNYFATVLIIIIIYNSKFDDIFIERITTIFKITVVLAIFASIIQIFHPHFLDAFQYDPTERNLISDNIYTDKRVSIFGFVDLNELGLSFIPLSSVIIGHLFRNKLKPYIYLIIAVGIISMVSNNRYCMIGFLVLTIQFAFYNKEGLKSYLKFISIAIVLILIFYSVLHFLGYDLLDWYHERLLAEGSIEQTTRWKAWGNFTYFFPKYYLWGTGEFNAPAVAHASHSIGSSQIHVGYLAHLISYGIIGSFFYFGFLFTLAKSLFKHAKLTNYWGSLFAFLIFLWSEATLVYYSVFLTGLIYALIFDKYYYDKYCEYFEKIIVDQQSNDLGAIKNFLLKKSRFNQFVR